MKDFRSINKELLQYDHLIIWGVSREAKHILYESFYADELYIDGFCSDVFCDHTIDNKKVFTRSEVKQLKNCAMLLSRKDIDAFLRSEMSQIPAYVDYFLGPVPEGIKPLFQFDSLLNGNNIIYGCGIYGKQLRDELKAQNIPVDFFCDSDVKKQGTYMDGIKILSWDEVCSMNEEKNILFGTCYWREIVQNIRYTGREKLLMDFFTYELSENRLVCPKQINFQVCDWGLYNLVSCAKGKIALLYGDKDIKEFIAQILIKTDTCRELRHLENVYDAFYENQDEIMVIDCSLDPYESEKIYLSSGFITGKNYIRGTTDFLLATIWIYRGSEDVLLGRTYTMEQIPGFTRFESSIVNQEKYRIVTLGGSTTDSQLTSFPCWSEMLARKLAEAGICADVICGGIAGYRSGNELLKLYRDVIRMKPNIVISYSGYNNVFNPSYKVGKYSGNTWMDTDIGERVDMLKGIYPNVVTGIWDNDNELEDWIYDERMMRAMCKESNIDFFAFFQPSYNTYGATNNWSYQQYSLNINAIDYERDTSSVYENDNIDKIKNRISRLEYDWLYDISDLFDQYDYLDIYMDTCHVNEKGNSIIADAIMKVIYNSMTDNSN